MQLDIDVNKDKILNKAKIAIAVDTSGSVQAAELFIADIAIKSENGKPNFEKKLPTLF